MHTNSILIQLTPGAKLIKLWLKIWRKKKSILHRNFFSEMKMAQFNAPPSSNETNQATLNMISIEVRLTEIMWSRDTTPKPWIFEQQKVTIPTICFSRLGIFTKFNNERGEKKYFIKSSNLWARFVDEARIKSGIYFWFSSIQ